MTFHAAGGSWRIVRKGEMRSCERKDNGKHGSIRNRGEFSLADESLGVLQPPSQDPLPRLSVVPDITEEEVDALAATTEFLMEFACLSRCESHRYHHSIDW
jgi:hypothetical protein